MARIVVDQNLHVEVQHADGTVQDLGTADFRGVALRSGVTEEHAKTTVMRDIVRWLVTEELQPHNDILITPEGTFQAFPWLNEGDWAKPATTFNQAGGRA